MMGDTLSFLPSLGPAGGYLFQSCSGSLPDFSGITVDKKCKKKLKKNIKNQGVSIDESLRKKYINFHRRFTAALLFDRSGKEITD